MTPENRNQGPGHWGEHDLSTGQTLERQIGPLHLRLEERAGEIRLAHWRGETPPDEELEWTRWATGPWGGRIALVPAFPDRPLVVEPESSFWLLHGADARIYVRVALQVEVKAVGPERDEATLLTRIPTLVNSDTWWGSPEEGELCYWLQTHARRAVGDDLFEDHLAICPLQLHNRSEDELHVEKIALRVDYLSLFADGDHIWSDETWVRYHGEDEGSRLEMSGKPPDEVGEARRLAHARLAMGRGFRARTFARLRSIQGWL